MISTFSVSVTTLGAICSRTKKSSIARRLFEPGLEQHERLTREVLRRHRLLPGQRVLRRRDDQQLLAENTGSDDEVRVVDGQREQVRDRRLPSEAAGRDAAWSRSSA